MFYSNQCIYDIDSGDGSVGACGTTVKVSLLFPINIGAGAQQQESIILELGVKWGGTESGGLLVKLARQSS